MGRIVWTAVAAILLAVAAIAVVIIYPEQEATALVLVGSSISMSILSMREEK